jgi:hypothetical protein
MIIEAFRSRGGRARRGHGFFRGSADRARGLERRLVAFADWLPREPRAQVMFVASAAPRDRLPGAQREARQKRSEALLGVVDQYLVNVPHGGQMCGTGDGSPKGGAGRARTLPARPADALREGQEPALPAEP